MPNSTDSLANDEPTTSLIQDETNPEEQGHSNRGQPRKRRRIAVEYLDFSPEAIEFVGKDVRSPEKTKRYTQIGKAHDLRFKMVKSDSRLIKSLLFAYGFTQTSSNNPSFNLLWTGTHLRSHVLRSLKPWQRVNHFPRSSELTRKDKLYDNILIAKTQFGQPYDFIPRFFVTPRDLTELNAEIEENSQNMPLYIVKPINSCQGKGIHFITKTKEISLESKLLVSNYIANPLLVDGHKFDLRVYIAVTSFYPLICYVYNEGLTRFASEKYSTTTIETGNEYVHLTNYSLNKNSNSFIKNETFSEEDFGHKWTLGALLRRLQNNGIDSRMLMVRIEDLVIKTLLSVQSSISAKCRSTVLHLNTNFELFGFDILVDSKLKPWLLEVNLSPSLACDAPLDSLVKTRLISDLFNLASVPIHQGSPNKTTAKTPSENPPSTPVALKRAHSPKILSNKSIELKSLKHVRKLQSEDLRQGGFIRVFPRTGSLPLYKSLMSHVGGERWDERLYVNVFGEEMLDREDVLSENFLERVHQQLMNTEKYPSSNSLDEDVATFITTWLDTTEAYLAKVSRHGEKYMAKLPALRQGTRLRTRSCAEFYEAKAAAKLVDQATVSNCRDAIDANVLTQVNMKATDLLNTPDFGVLVENRLSDPNSRIPPTTTVSC